jgi:hypothetical protein
MSDKGPIKVQDTVLGSHYLGIRAAVKILERHKLDLSEYTILVVREGKSVVVLLIASKEKEGAPKQLGVRQGDATELNARDLSALLAKLNQLTTLEKIQGRSLLAIRAAEEVFLSRDPKADLARYKVEVLREGDSVLVIFVDKDRKPGTRGTAAGQAPGFEVELKANDLSFVRANFSR